MGILAINGGNPTKLDPFDLQAVFGDEEKQAVIKILESRVISGFIANSSKKFYGGDGVLKLEESFMDYFDIPYAVSMNSATSALHAAVVATGVKAGDEVIVPAMSMSASASAILMAGGTPRFVDVHAGQDAKGLVSYNIDETQLEEAINTNTKSIIVVHLFGIPANMDIIMNISRKYGIHIIEDCAQAPGATLGNKKVGTIGDIGVFSFTQSKTVSSGEGGLAITNNEKFAIRMQLIRNHAEAMIESFPQAEYEKLIGYNYRMTELEAAVAKVQFSHIDEWNKRKIILANILSEVFDDVPGLSVLSKIKPYDNVLFLYPIIYDQNELGIHRNIFTKAVRAEGIPFLDGYTTPLINLPLFREFKQNNLPYNADILFNDSMITTKICHHHNVSIEDIELTNIAIHKVINNINELK